MILSHIKSLCDRRGITISKLEKKAGLSNGAIGKWNTSSPSLLSLEKVAKALDVKLSELIREPSEETAPCDD